MVNIKIRGLILDMDGVLWRGKEPIGDLPAIFQMLDEKQIKITFATNNATRTPDQYIQKLASFGVKATQEQIFTSAKATAAYLSAKYPTGTSVYTIGETGLLTALKEKGLDPHGIDPFAVVVGLDTQINYQKLSQATLLINGGLPFYGTNPDLTFPTPQGLKPGAGAILAAIQAATGKQPHIIGKPAPHMFQQAIQALSISPQETLVVGDRLETDIAGGQAAGCQTALLLSGVSTKEMGQNWSPTPDFILDDLAQLVKMVL